MKTLIRVIIYSVLLASAGYAENILVGMTEKTLLETKGAPESKATAGDRIFYRWRDLQATVIKGKVVEARSPIPEKRNTGSTNRAPTNRPPITVIPANNRPANNGSDRTNPKATAASAPIDDAATANKKKEARREQLAEEIARYQSIMDQFDKQNAFAKPRPYPWFTREDYENAKAERNKRQQERNDLAR